MLADAHIEAREKANTISSRSSQGLVFGIQLVMIAVMFFHMRMSTTPEEGQASNSTSATDSDNSVAERVWVHKALLGLALCCVLACVIVGIWVYLVRPRLAKSKNFLAYHDAHMKAKSKKGKKE